MADGRDPSGMKSQLGLDNFCLYESLKLLMQEIATADISTWIPPVASPVYAQGYKYGENQCSFLTEADGLRYYDCNAIRLPSGSCRDATGNRLSERCQCRQSDGATSVPDRYSIHAGVDFSTNKTAVFAVDDAHEWYSVNSQIGYGNHLILKHNNGLYSLYAHLSEFNLSTLGKSRIRKGDTIGTSGTTGNSSADHLHFEIRRAREVLRSYPRSVEELNANFVDPTGIPGVSAVFSTTPAPYAVNYNLGLATCPNTDSCCANYRTF